MAKKGKDDTPTANGVVNRDIIQRLNFLYQASVYLNTLSSTEASTSSPLSISRSDTNVLPCTSQVIKARKNKKRCSRNDVTASDLSRTYIATMKSVGQKTMVKIDPAVKRTLCKGCNTTLIPGATTTVRVKSSPAHGHTMIYTCTVCNTTRRIPAPPRLREDGTAASNEPQLVSSFPIASTTEESASMNIDLPQEPSSKKGEREKGQARVPPLFARDVGHVVFCGSERLLDNELGDGVYIT